METISNQAHVTFSYGNLDTTKTNNSNIVISSIKDRFSLSVEKTSTTNCFRAGEIISYMVTVKNTGCGCLSNFTLTESLNEDYVSYVEGSGKLFMNGSMATLDPSDLSPLTFLVSGNIERDESFIFQYNVMVNSDISPEVNEITNRVEVRGYPCGCTCNENNNCVEGEAEHTIPKCEFAEVLITKSVCNDNVCCGEELDYLITLTNTGNVDAMNVVVTDSLPANFTVMEIHKENNGVHYKYDASEYDIDDANLLTLPNETGTIIEVPALAPGVDNTTRIRIHGHM